MPIMFDVIVNGMLVAVIERGLLKPFLKLIIDNAPEEVDISTVVHREEAEQSFQEFNVEPAASSEQEADR